MAICTRCNGTGVATIAATESGAQIKGFCLNCDGTGVEESEYERLSKIPGGLTDWLEE